MQLERLTMQNFGPYRDATVDFTAFADAPLFLISGKTGSGKTTIFDALVFALYGTTTGDDRSGREMRATFAAPDQPTRVTLTFSHGGKQYTIWREPDQLLAKKRGAGLTSAPMRLSLTERQDGVERNEWTKVRDVAPRIETLLHLDADQFRQMILLPQGKFRQFLDAKSDDKEALLRHLFGTGLYAGWQLNLRQAARTQRAKVQKQADRLDTLAGQFSYGAAQPAADSPLPDKLALMHDQLADLQAAVTASETALATAQARAEQASQAAQAGATLQAALADRQAAQTALAALDAQAPAVAAAQAQLEQLTWVATQAATATQLATQATELKARAARLTTLAQELTQAQATQQAATQQQAALAAQQATQQAARRQLATLQALRPRLAALADQAEAVTAAQAAQATADQTLEHQQAAQAKLAAALAANQAAQAAVADHRSAQAQAAAALAAATPRYEQWQQATAALAKQAATVTAAQTAATQAATERTQAQAAYTRLHDTQLRQQIARLAAQLSPGQPCPVCGSPTHPHPAQTAADHAAPVSDAALEAADAARQAAEQTAATAAATVARLTEQQASLRETQQAAAAALIAGPAATGVAPQPEPTQPVAEATVTTAYAALTAAAEQAEAAVAAEQAEREQLAQAAQTLATQQAAQAEQSQRATAAAQAAAVALAQAEGARAAAQAAVPADAPTLSALDRRVTALEQQLSDHEAAVAAAQQALTAAESTVSRLRATHTELTQQQTAAQTTHEDAAQAFAAALAEHFGADGAAQFAALQARLDERPALAEQVAAAQTARVKQTALLAHANAQIGTQPAPDLPALTAAKQAAAAALAAAQTAQANAVQQATRNQALVATIEAEYAQNQQMMDEAAAMENLFQVVNGNNRPKLSLERYVLRAYLQRVLTVANTRLQTLSGGRYLFTLHQDPGSYRNDSGLEIDVYDDQIGATRSVHTLSGGESFVAALALALALGEVIQQESGGVAIDALFVDEGFGSLDASSLATAMAALQSLEGQSRMIGIISHVTELRESIPDQLQVIPDGTGESHLRMRRGLSD